MTSSVWLVRSCRWLRSASCITFLVTAMLVRRLPGWRRLLFPLAGAVAMVALHLTLKAAFDIRPIAAARSGTGLLLQALAGAVGGYVLTLTTPGTPRAEK